MLASFRRYTIVILPVDIDFFHTLGVYVMSRMLDALQSILFLVLGVLPLSALLIAPLYAVWPVATLLSVVVIVLPLIAIRFWP